ncbi:cell wall-binding repeat-containing protein [Kytococcus sedentarius]|uniref:Cell wall-binding protein n=1 Tax=Kytococcus sedentarius (strain ATCC 14392 / DSM 20547 / JCM 11482 / CCUG 33030 / NBRC 15357 / NCTC 11040 / CCM 314 / 541) TaxID=478801 RepID=C7NL78_KYTSD|nr:cell wall-binding repeat-containing protein [Kytococcus sedentarius]ACV05620.1 cell wall-binding protein [Kytococcus sedentarius DSM 20547]QQB64044.1 cell wall-binding repeat-containing protein [Kytococcus sedentarius]STX12964.1 N-acetylmuramoyl-L-alanine amidase LytC precursor [Kytococcus sedentarius]
MVTHRSLPRHATASAIAIAMAGVIAPATTAAPATQDASSAGTFAVAHGEARDAAAKQEFTDGQYIVTFRDQPTVAYDGHLKGLAATSPAKGEKFDVQSAAVQKYESHLVQRQDAVLATVGAKNPVVRYTTALSGVGVTLTAEQAAELARSSEVISVAPEEMLELHTDTSPEFLGLTGENGVWNTGNGLKGEGMVVGVIDSGISHHNPSFAEGDMAPAPADWKGVCATEAPQDFPSDACNNKLIGARFYVEGFGKSRIADHESLSPLDVGGHGSHTASTAAGNEGVTATVNGEEHGVISGMAPMAHVAAYKVCWDEKGGDGGCSSLDSVKAIDDAVADGVDVLNYSISGTSSNYIDPVEIAFMNAAANGIFVAASSGNSGPKASTTNHPSPWLTTVAASTHRIAENTLVTGDGERYIGSSVTGGLPEAPMILAQDAKAASATAEDANLCKIGSLDPALVAGKIVVCDRGVTARTEKSDVVAEAGGVGMVLINPTESSLDTDAHVVPTVHLSHTHRDVVRAYASGEGATASILETNEGSTTEVPEIAGFSSRGPSLGGEGDILKPDVSAPGVGVLAAYATPERGADAFGYSSGTSMSSPHIAGLAALVKQANPEWSPMAVKSALMTTTRDHMSAASNDPFATGAGFVEPRRMLSPGLVYDAGEQDWWDFLAGQGVTRGGKPVSENPIDASDLNQASIALGQLLGQQTITRTITNTTDATATWTGTIAGLEGVKATLSQSTVTLDPGESADVEITFVDETLAKDAWTKGTLTWTAAGQNDVRSPIAVRAGDLKAPQLVEGKATDATIDIPMISGEDRDVSIATRGLVKGDDVRGEVRLPSSRDDLVIDDPNNFRYDFEGSRYSTVWTEIIPDDPSVDLDLYVTYKGMSLKVGQAATAGAAERILIPTLYLQDDYTVHVQAYDLGGADSTGFTLRTFVLPEKGDAGNLTFANPFSLEQGVETNVPGTISVDDTSAPWFGKATTTPPNNSFRTLAETYVLLEPGEKGEPGLERIEGRDRYATAAEISKKFGSSDTVYIASGMNFADAMSGTAAAGAGIEGLQSLPDDADKEIPVLLTRPDRIPPQTTEALQSLGAKRVVLVGGETAISEKVADELAASGLSVERISGANRYETSANVAKSFRGDVETLYIASGDEKNYADALAGSALAGSQDVPVLLTRPDRVLPTTMHAVSTLKPKNIVVLGGETAVSPEVYETLGATERLAGSDRYGTAVEIAKEFPAKSDFTGYATGMNWPDSLTGGAYAAKEGGPLLLTRPDRLPPVVSDYVTANPTTQNVIYGSEAAVSQNVEDALRGLLGL